MHQVAHKGCRDHNGARSKLPQDDSVQESRSVHPGADLDDFMEHEGNRGKPSAKSDEIDLGHEHGKLEELLSEEKEQGETRGGNEEKEQQRDGRVPHAA